MANLIGGSLTSSLALIVVICSLIVTVALVGEASRGGKPFLVAEKPNSKKTPYEVAVIVPNEDDFQVCQSSNRVPIRIDNIGNIDVEIVVERPYSLRLQDFTLSQQLQPQSCSNLVELLDAIKLGERQWDNQTDVLNETIPSTFVPHACHIPHLSSDEMCDIMNLFASVIFLGDSLSRHIQAGMIVGLKNDFVSGPLRGSKLAEGMCRCDGLFSEHDFCREYPSNFSSLNAQSICPSLIQNNTSPSMPLFQEHFGGLSQRWLNQQVNLTCGHDNNHTQQSKDDRGVLLVLQGGIQLGFNVEKVLRQKLIPLLSDPNLMRCAHQKQLYIIWQSHGSQSPLMDKKYPSQRESNVLLYNNAMNKHLQNASSDSIVRVDWMNFTKRAQVSDGVHFLTNVNYFKAQYIFSIAKMMKEEGRYTSLIG